MNSLLQLCNDLGLVELGALMLRALKTPIRLGGRNDGGADYDRTVRFGSSVLRSIPGRIV